MWCISHITHTFTNTYSYSEYIFFFKVDVSSYLFFSSCRHAITHSFMSYVNTALLCRTDPLFHLSCSNSLMKRWLWHLTCWNYSLQSTWRISNYLITFHRAPRHQAQQQLVTLVMEEVAAVASFKDLGHPCNEWRLYSYIRLYHLYIIMLSVLHVRVDKHSMVVVVMSHPSMMNMLFSSNTNTCMHASCCCCWPASCLCGIKERLFVLLIMYGTSNCFVYLSSQEPLLLIIIIVIVILIACTCII